MDEETLLNYIVDKVDWSEGRYYAYKNNSSIEVYPLIGDYLTSFLMEQDYILIVAPNNKNTYLVH